MTNDDSTDKLVPALVAMMSDGFNRSLAAIESVGAIDSTRLREDYKPGSRFYEIVTSQLYETAIAAQQTVRNAVD